MAKMENDAEGGGPGGRPRGKSGGGFAEDLIAIEERRRSAEADAGGWSAAGRAFDRELTEKQEECTTSGATDDGAPSTECETRRVNGIDMVVHKVVPTDTMMGLSVRYGVSQTDICQANGVWSSFAGGNAGSTLMLRREILIPKEPLPAGWKSGGDRKKSGSGASSRLDSPNGDLMARYWNGDVSNGVDASRLPTSSAAGSVAEGLAAQEDKGMLSPLTVRLRNMNPFGGLFGDEDARQGGVDVMMKDGAAPASPSRARGELKRRGMSIRGPTDQAGASSSSSEENAHGQLDSVGSGVAAAGADANTGRGCFSFYPGHVVRVLSGRSQGLFGAGAGMRRPGANAGPTPLSPRRVGGARTGGGSVELERLNTGSAGAAGVMKVPSVTKFVDKND